MKMVIIPGKNNPIYEYGKSINVYTSGKKWKAETFKDTGNRWHVSLSVINKCEDKDEEFFAWLCADEYFIYPEDKVIINNNTIIPQNRDELLSLKDTLNSWYEYYQIIECIEEL